MPLPAKRREGWASADSRHARSADLHPPNSQQLVMLPPAIKKQAADPDIGEPQVDLGIYPRDVLDDVVTAAAGLTGRYGWVIEVGRTAVETRSPAATHVIGAAGYTAAGSVRTRLTCRPLPVLTGLGQLAAPDLKRRRVACGHLSTDRMPLLGLA